MATVEARARHLEAVVAPPPQVTLPSPLLTPPEQLQEILRQLHEAKMAFDLAWAKALVLVRWPASRRDASEWQRVLDQTKEGWRASYEGWMPEPREVAVGELVRLLSAELRAS